MSDTASIASVLSPAITAGLPTDVSKFVGKMSGAQIDQTSKDFESMFVSQMMEQMFGDSVGNEAFGSEETGDIYKGMMMDAYGKEISKAGGIGIASYVKRELLKLQETK